MTTLLLAEHDGAKLSPETAKALTAAAAMGAPVHVLVAGAGVDAVAGEAAALSGAEKVLQAEGEALQHGLAEPLAALIVGLAGDYGALVAPATTTGKNVLPRVAALLDVMQVSDIVSVESPTTFKRPIYAGNAIQTVESADAFKVVTVRTTAFDAAGDGGSAAIEKIESADNPGLSEFVSEEVSGGDRPDLTSARVVISGGRALGSKEKFDELITPLADKLNAAVGASRAAVDAGYAANDLQVGQTGKAVAPELYIALGISGAIQHVAGMKESGVVVAINNDPEAPIFSVADYGLVADIFAAVPELSDAL